MSRAETITRAKGGDWHGHQGLMPTPGHSSKDRGLSIRDTEDGSDVVLFAHNEPDFDWRAYKDTLRGEGLLPDFEPSRPAEPRQSTPYVYSDASGQPSFRMVRRSNPKTFHAEHWTGTAWATGMGGKSPLPYRLNEIIGAHPDALVFIVEGEKDADNLAARGFIATTNPNGAGKWRDEFCGFLQGRECIILPDNDEPGLAHAQDVWAKLKAAGVASVILSLPGLPDKGDVSDWLAMGGTDTELTAMAAAAWDADAPVHEPAPTLPLIDLAAWQGVEPPSREWAWRDMMPARQMTLLAGLGSAGKSLLAQQLATCSAVGLPCLGVSTADVPTIYITCEDDADELHRRQQAICDAIGVPLHGLTGRLHLASIFGQTGNELATFDHLGRMATTPAWERLRATATAIKAGLIVLDNVAHLFAGNENSRHQVAAFCGLLNRLALETGAAVLLIGHPAKADGSQYSGSTAWENQVRSRLFLETPADEHGNVVDRDVRRLTTAKSNYARNGDALAFRWHRWCFVLDADLPAEERDTLAVKFAEMAADTAFLACLAKATTEKRATSAARSASNYAPRLFAEMPTAKGATVRSLEGALQRLLHNGTIANGVTVYRRDNRAAVTGLGLAPTLAPTMLKPVHQPCTDPCDDTGNDVHQPARTHPPSTTYYSGAALGADAPEFRDEQPHGEPA